jgi:hypothetical protein
MRHAIARPDNPDRPQPADNPAAGEPEPSIITEKTIADFTRVVEQTGMLRRQPDRTEE